MRLLLLAVSLLAGTVGCAGSDSGHGRGPIVVVDDAGDTTRLERPASRVVSLVPATTELLFALGAGGQLVGRTSWGDYPPQALSVEEVGDGINPNLEAVLGRNPDLVVMYHSAQNFAAADRLRQLGIAVLVLHVDLLEQVVPNALRLGRATGHSATADSLVAEFRLALDTESSTRSESGDDLFIMAWDQPPMTLGAGSFVSQLVSLAGHRNVFGDIAAPSAPVALEAIAARDPDWIVLLGNGPAAFLDRPEWQVVPAVRERRLVRLVGSQFEWPGPRSPTAVSEVREQIAAAAR